MNAPVFSRPLQLQLPYDRGLDVLALQNQLVRANIHTGGAPDGVYGPMTAAAMRAWQAKQGLPVTGVCDAVCWKRLFPAAPDPADRLPQLVERLGQDHLAFMTEGACRWRVDAGGLHIDNHPAQGSLGQPVTVRGIWEKFGAAISTWSTQLGVPAELIIATIGTESSGKPDAIRFEPRYTSDEATPNQVSPGLMQTLVSTARSVLANPAIDRDWLLVPEHSIQAGTAYILQQSRQTGFDPPLVACCYNAGRIAFENNPRNRWKMLQYPVGTGDHCDRFVQWFNDAMTVFAQLPEPPPVSFVRLLGTQPVQQAEAA